MDPQVRTLIQGVLDAYIPSWTMTGDPSFNPQDQGRFAGKTPPDGLEEFRNRLEDAVSSFKFNGWTLDLVEKNSVIDDAMGIYIGYYADWVNKPLPTTAPPEVVAWQKDARKAENLVPKAKP